jgi:hypothetical protein
MLPALEPEAFFSLRNLLANVLKLKGLDAPENLFEYESRVIV